MYIRTLFFLILLFSWRKLKKKVLRTSRGQWTRNSIHNYSPHGSVSPHCFRRRTDWRVSAWTRDANGACSVRRLTGSRPCRSSSATRPACRGQTAVAQTGPRSTARGSKALPCVPHAARGSNAYCTLRSGGIRDASRNPTTVSARLSMEESLCKVEWNKGHCKRGIAGI